MGVFEILKKAFFACLNLVDFVTDTLVLLRLSCFLGDSDKGQPCTGAVSSTCQSHPWWIGIGFVILLVSSVLGAIAWVSPETAKWNRLRSTQRTLKGGLRIEGLFLIGLLQLSPFVDLFDLIKNRVDPEKKKASMRRDLWTKTLESGPQALFHHVLPGLAERTFECPFNFCLDLESITWPRGLLHATSRCRCRRGEG